MERQEMKRLLKSISKPVKLELFKEIGYSKEEITLMEYLYIEKIEQPWVCDEMGMSQPTLTKKHNDCIKQLLNYFNYQKYRLDNHEDNTFNKYFLGIESNQN